MHSPVAAKMLHNMLKQAPADAQAVVSDPQVSAAYQVIRE
jgi:hypothetical protein